MDNRHTVLCIIGQSGSGKDTAARIIQKEFDYKMVCSYTTRPKRDTETNGREHLFITKEEADKIISEQSIVAYTKLADYEYFATEQQLLDSNIYIIDPFGVNELEHTVSNNIKLIKLYIDAPYEVRRQRALNRANNQEEEFKRRNNKEKNDFLMFKHNKDYDEIIVNDDTLSKEELTVLLKFIVKYRVESKQIKMAELYKALCYGYDNGMQNVSECMLHYSVDANNTDDKFICNMKEQFQKCCDNNIMNGNTDIKLAKYIIAKENMSSE